MPRGPKGEKRPPAFSPLSAQSSDVRYQKRSGFNSAKSR